MNVWPVARKNADKDGELYPEKTMFQNLRVVSSVTSEESDPHGSKPVGSKEVLVSRCFGFSVVRNTRPNITI